MGTTPIYGFPYPDPSDLVANYPALGQQLAEDVETELAAAGKVLQIVSFSSTTQTTTTSTTFVTTGVTATITPRSATNKVYIAFSTGLYRQNANNGVQITLFRGTVAGTNLGNASAGFGNYYDTSGGTYVPAGFVYVDSPNTTSAQIYTAAMKTDGASTSIGAQMLSSVGTIILMELAA